MPGAENKAVNKTDKNSTRKDPQSVGETNNEQNQLYKSIACKMVIRTIEKNKARIQDRKCLYIKCLYRLKF